MGPMFLVEHIHGVLTTKVWNLGLRRIGHKRKGLDTNGRLFDMFQRRMNAETLLVNLKYVIDAQWNRAQRS